MATGNPESKRKAGGGKLSRSETVTVRFDPKLRYLAELAARKQRRTVSSFIEWAVEEALERVVIEENRNYGKLVEVKLAEAGADLWDVDEPDRFARLALRYPDLLTHEEQIVWKLMVHCGHLWRGHLDNDTGRWIWETRLDTLVWERLREQWSVFNDVAQGRKARSALPKWEDNSVADVSDHDSCGNGAGN
jgi:hypothetical protein